MLQRWRLAALASGALALVLAVAAASAHAQTATISALATSQQAQLAALQSALQRAQTEAHASSARAQHLANAAPTLHAAKMQDAQAQADVAAAAAAAAAPGDAAAQVEVAAAVSAQRKTSVDPATPKEAADKYKHEGMSLIMSDEFKDLEHTKSLFVFEDMPYGVPGNTGDVNIVSAYTKDMISLLPEGGLRLSSQMSDKSYEEFVKGFNKEDGTNTNYDTLPELWEWHAPKVTSRLNGRFQYGLVEVRLKAPKGYGPWPAAWLNGCYGFVSEATGEFLLQDDYPFLCGQFWPPELDFFEHFSPEHTWWWRPNSMSVHSPNQYVGLGRNNTPQHGYCPTTLSGPGEAWCFGVSGAGAFHDDPTDRYVTYAMKWEPESVAFYMDGHFMLRFTRDQLVLYLNGQLRPIMIPEMPLFLTFNTALVRKGMDASHQGPGLTAADNFDKATGEWKGMDFDIAWVRVYQDDSQGETSGLNPPITYETRKKLLANRVTCNLIPELRCLIKNSTAVGEAAILEASCNKLAALGDDYCDTIDHLCSLNNAGNPTGTYGLSPGMKANMANQHLSLVHGVCCVDNSNMANEHANCHDTPKTRLPEWLRESEYFKDPPVGKEGLATGVMGTNPAGWKTYGLGLKPHLEFPAAIKEVSLLNTLVAEQPHKATGPGLRGPR